MVTARKFLLHAIGSIVSCILIIGCQVAQVDCALGDPYCRPLETLVLNSYNPESASDPLCNLLAGTIQNCDLAVKGVVTTFTGTITTAGNTDGVGTGAQFSGPNGITYDGTYLYVADSNNHTIRRVDPATGTVTTFAGNGSPGSADGVGTAAQFSNPDVITTDGTYLYVIEAFSNTVRRIEIATQNVITFAGDGTPATVDGTGTGASFNGPIGITTDGSHLYVAEANRIRKITLDTAVVTTYAGSGAATSTDGIGTGASFNGLRGLTTDGTNLYAAETNARLIRKIEIASATVTTLAGSGVNATTDGTGTAAAFNTPARLTTDGEFLYVTEAGGHTLRKVDLTSLAVTTVAGMPGASGSSDGTGAAAGFFAPAGVTSDGTSLYVADNGNHALRKIQ